MVLPKKKKEKCAIASGSDNQIPTYNGETRLKFGLFFSFFNVNATLTLSLIIKIYNYG